MYRTALLSALLLSTLSTSVKAAPFVYIGVVPNWSTQSPLYVSDVFISEGRTSLEAMIKVRMNDIWPDLQTNKVFVSCVKDESSFFASTARTGNDEQGWAKKLRSLYCPGALPYSPIVTTNNTVTKPSAAPMQSSDSPRPTLRETLSDTPFQWKK